MDEDENEREALLTTVAVDGVVAKVADLRVQRDGWAKFERALEGVGEWRREEIWRVIEKLGLRPDDPAVLILAVAGHAETVALALESDVASAADAAARALSARLQSDFEHIERSMAKRLARMQDSSLALVDEAVRAATDSAATAAGKSFGERAGAEIEELSKRLGNRVEHLTASLVVTLNGIVETKVRVEREESKTERARLVERLKCGAIGAAVGGLCVLACVAVVLLATRH